MKTVFRWHISSTYHVYPVQPIPMPVEYETRIRRAVRDVQDVVDVSKVRMNESKGVLSGVVEGVRGGVTVEPVLAVCCPLLFHMVLGGDCVYVRLRT